LSGYEPPAISKQQNVMQLKPIKIKKIVEELIQKILENIDSYICICILIIRNYSHISNLLSIEKEKTLKTSSRISKNWN
jgi:hypothetical protein